MALTRAEVTCTLSYALTRFKWGQVTQGDSRFLEEIDEGCIVHPQQAPTSRSPVDFAQARSQFQRMPSGTAPRSFGRLASQAHPFQAHEARQLVQLEGSRESGSAGASRSPPAPPLPLVGRQHRGGRHRVHAKFGKGRVLHIEGSAPMKRRPSRSRPWAKTAALNSPPKWSDDTPRSLHGLAFCFLQLPARMVLPA